VVRVERIGVKYERRIQLEEWQIIGVEFRANTEIGVQTSVLDVPVGAVSSASGCPLLDTLYTQFISGRSSELIFRLSDQQFLHVK